MEKDFIELIGSKIAEKLKWNMYSVEWILCFLKDLKFQKVEQNLGGTAHALLCCKDVVKEPFAIINADDFYGKGSYQTLHDYLADETHKQYALLDIF